MICRTAAAVPRSTGRTRVPMVTMIVSGSLLVRIRPRYVVENRRCVRGSKPSAETRPRHAWNTWHSARGRAAARRNVSRTKADSALQGVPVWNTPCTAPPCTAPLGPRRRGQRRPGSYAARGPPPWSYAARGPPPGPPTPPRLGDTTPGPAPWPRSRGAPRTLRRRPGRLPRHRGLPRRHIPSGPRATGATRGVRG